MVKGKGKKEKQWEFHTVRSIILRKVPLPSEDKEAAPVFWKDQASPLVVKNCTAVE